MHDAETPHLPATFEAVEVASLGAAAARLLLSPPLYVVVGADARSPRTRGEAEQEEEELGLCGVGVAYDSKVAGELDKSQG